MLGVYKKAHVYVGLLGGNMVKTEVMSVQGIIDSWDVRKENLLERLMPKNLLQPNKVCVNYSLRLPWSSRDCTALCLKSWGLLWLYILYTRHPSSTAGIQNNLQTCKIYFAFCFCFFCCCCCCVSVLTRRKNSAGGMTSAREIRETLSAFLHS